MSKNQTLARPIGRFEGMWLIARREIVTTLRSKAFMWSFITTIVLVAAVILGQGAINRFMESMVLGDETETVASTVDLGEVPADSSLTVVQVESAADAVAQVESGEASSAVVTGAESADLTLLAPDGSELPAGVYAAQPLVVIGDDSVSTRVVDLLTAAPATAVLDAETAGSFMVTFFLSMAFAVVYFAAIMMFSQRIAQTVIEEKASRIVELLLATVKPVTVLAGKVVGGTIVAFAQVALIVLVAIGSFLVTGQRDILDLIGLPMVWFAVLFLVGFVLFACLYAALASTVSRPEDVASATSPLTFLIMIPYMLVIFANQNDTVMTWMSYIPFSAPVAMPVRMFNSGAEWWEPFLTLAILIVTVVAALWLAARIYENSILRTGGKVKLSEALRSS